MNGEPSVDPEKRDNRERLHKSGTAIPPRTATLLHSLQRLRRYTRDLDRD